jgi:hypothetical protein
MRRAAAVRFPWQTFLRAASCPRSWGKQAQFTPLTCGPLFHFAQAASRSFQPGHRPINSGHQGLKQACTAAAGISLATALDNDTNERGGLSGLTRGPRRRESPRRSSKLTASRFVRFRRLSARRTACRAASHGRFKTGHRSKATTLSADGSRPVPPGIHRIMRESTARSLSPPGRENYGPHNFKISNAGVIRRCFPNGTDVFQAHQRDRP